MSRLRLLYTLIAFINYLYSQWGWRLLHCYISLYTGFAKYNFSLGNIYFLIGYWIALEFICNKYLFPFDKYHQIGKEILHEILEEINKEKGDD